jgi:hypothetical protein
MVRLCGIIQLDAATHARRTEPQPDVSKRNMCYSVIRGRDQLGAQPTATFTLQSPGRH